MTAAKGGDLDDFPPDSHMNDLKAASDNPGAAKALLDLFGGGIGGDVEVFGVLADQQIPHSAPDHESIETVLLQLLNNEQRPGRKIRGLKNRCLQRL
jgi:hypothetical protein